MLEVLLSTSHKHAQLTACKIPSEHHCTIWLSYFITFGWWHFWSMFLEVGCASFQPTQSSAK